ncbi:MAG: CoA transferase subunit A [Clostridiales bacterium]|nr:CoA transferase subunit A [Clostridiales bacterium]
MPKFISMEDAARMIPAGATIMVGGFMGCGSPHGLLTELARIGTGGLTLICNDGACPNGPDGSEFYGVAKLIHNRQVKKLIATHVGLNPEVAAQMNEGTLLVELIPQGSLAEMIRAGGYGLGGVLTPTGYGTIVQDAPHVHSVIEIDGVNYLLEKPIRADFALLGGHTIDRAGNIWYKGTTRNFNLPMATAADIVIAEAEHIVEIGAIEPENMMTPGILVDYVVGGME